MQLSHQPTVETRNRKKMRLNKVASWELRVGTLRVFYDAEEEPNANVSILAVGIKTGNTVYVAGEAIEWDHEND